MQRKKKKPARRAPVRKPARKDARPPDRLQVSMSIGQAKLVGLLLGKLQLSDLAGADAAREVIALRESISLALKKAAPKKSADAKG